MDVATAIRDMLVRGAPAIGISAAYGVALGAKQHWSEHHIAWQDYLLRDMEYLGTARPTAVNLAWALKHMSNIVQAMPANQPPFIPLLQEASTLHTQDAMLNQRMGALGASLIHTPTAVITHCNAGALATGGYGTALGVIRAAHTAGNLTEVFADETRPWLQGARLTTWELQRSNIPVTLMVESAAATCMAQGKIGWIIVGADRIAANGDFANKIGTYPLAIAAHYHKIPLMVVAPTTTIDMATPTGLAIPIEERTPNEILHCGTSTIAPQDTKAWNPVFDVTPATLVNTLVTERGIVHHPDANKLAELMDS
jgi:methylthioribose-1-phosphate isomerase